jgi:hypothetical protein
VRYAAAFLCVLVVTSPLAAQGDHGGVGRAGGSRTAHEGQQSEALAQNNDPRFIAYKKLIDQDLNKTVRQVVSEYEQVQQKKKIQLAPDQFLAVQVAAKQYNIRPTTLAASVGSPAGAHHMLAAPAQPAFQEQLANSLQKLAGLEPAIAQDAAKKAVAAVAAVPPAS